MEFRPGDRVWVKRNHGHWWPALVDGQSSHAEETNKKKRRTCTGTSITVRYPFEETSEVVKDERRIKSFDCPESGQLTTLEQNERSSRRRSSIDKDLFQRALSALLNNNESSDRPAEDTPKDAGAQQESVNISSPTSSEHLDASKPSVPESKSHVSPKSVVANVPPQISVKSSVLVLEPMNSYNSSALNSLDSPERTVMVPVESMTHSLIRSDINLKRFCSDLPEITPRKNSRRTLTKALRRFTRSNDDISSDVVSSVGDEVVNSSVRNDVVSSDIVLEAIGVGTSDVLTSGRLRNESPMASPVKRLSQDLTTQTTCVPTTPNLTTQTSRLPTVQMSGKSARKLIYAFHESLQETPIKACSKNENREMRVVNESSSRKTNETNISNTLTSRTSKNATSTAGSLCTEFLDDSDDDLPVFSSLTPSKQQGANFAPGDIVWAKYRHLPPWPAVVRTVYRKRRRLDKISVFFIGDPFKKEQSGLRIKYHPNNVKHFCTEGGHSLERRDDPRMMDIVKMVDDYLTKKALGKIHKSPFDHFKVADEEPSTGDEADVSVGYDDLSKDRQDDVIDRLTSSDAEDDNIPDGCSPNQPIPDKVVNEIKRGATRSQKLVDFLRTDDCKKFALAVIRGKEESVLHNRFNPDDRFTVGSFGPVEDDEQIYEIFDVLMKICGEENYLTFAQRQNYVLSVLAPETIVFAMRRCIGYSRPRAWALFSKGPHHSKALQQYEHESIVASVERMPQEDRIRYQQMREGRWQRLLEKFDLC